MKGKRLIITMRLWMTLSNAKRTEYLKKKKVFGYIGENTTIMDRTVPLYAKLIKLGSNVKVASNVKFITHDTSFRMLNLHPALENNKFIEKLGCIEIGDNVFVGAGTTILYNVKIGSNVIIGANSLINKDIPDNAVVAGCPARIIGNFNDFVTKRIGEAQQYPIELSPKKEVISEELEDILWKNFENCRKG